MTRITELTGARLLPGKVVKAIHGNRTENTGNRQVFHVGIIEFADGSYVTLGVDELEGDYAVTMTYRPKKKGGAG